MTRLSVSVIRRAVATATVGPVTEPQRVSHTKLNKALNCVVVSRAYL